MVNDEKDTLVLHTKHLLRYCHDHANITCSVGGYLTHLKMVLEKTNTEPETVKALMELNKRISDLLDAFYKEVHKHQPEL